MSDMDTLARKLRPALKTYFAHLDEFYAEGTYTPTYTGATTAGTTTYTTQAGFYTRVGRVVYFNGRLIWSAATGTGLAVLSLPFTPANTTDMRYSVTLRVDGVTFANSGVQGRIAPNDPRIFLDSPTSNAGSAGVNVEAAGDIIFSGWFCISDGGGAGGGGGGGGSGGAPTDAYYIVGASNATLTNEIVIPPWLAHPDALPASANAYDDEFDAGALDAKWTWLNQGSASATLGNSYCLLNCPGQASDNIRGIYQSVTGTWKITAHINFASTVGVNSLVSGLLAYDSVSGRLEVFGPVNTAAGTNINLYRYTNTTTFSSNAGDRVFPRGGYFQVEDDGTNLIYRYSFDGLHWCQVFSETRTNFLTNGANKVGLAVNTTSGTTACAIAVDWIRKA